MSTAVYYLREAVKCAKYDPIISECNMHFQAIELRIIESKAATISTSLKPEGPSISRSLGRGFGPRTLLLLAPCRDGFICPSTSTLDRRDGRDGC